MFPVSIVLVPFLLPSKLAIITNQINRKSTLNIILFFLNSPEVALRQNILGGWCDRIGETPTQKRSVA